MLQEISSEYYPVWNLKFRSKILDFLKKENIVSNNFFELKRSDREGLIAFGAIVSSIGLTAIPI